MLLDTDWEAQNVSSVLFVVSLGVEALFQTEKQTAKTRSFSQLGGKGKRSLPGSMLLASEEGCRSRQTYLQADHLFGCLVAAE